MTVVLGRLELPRQNKKILYRHDRPNERTNQGRTPFICESPFNSSTVIRGHPSLVSLVWPYIIRIEIFILMGLVINVIYY